MMTIVVAVCMARLIPKEEVGVYRQALLCYWMVAPLLELGVRQAIYYYVPTNTPMAIHWFRGAVGILLSNAIIFSLGILFFGPLIAEKMGGGELMSSMLWWLIPYALFHLPSMVQESMLVAIDKSTLSAKVAVVRQLLISVGTLIPLMLWRDVYQQFVWHVMITATTGLAVLLMVNYEAKKKLLGCDELRESHQSDFLSIVTSLYKVALPFGVAAIIGSLAMSTDKFIVSVYFDPEVFAEFSYGAMEVPFIGIITGSMMAIYLTEMRRKIAEDKPNEAVSLFAQSAIGSAAFLFPIFAFLLVISKDFVVLLYGSEYLNSILIFQIYLLLIPVRIVFFGSMLTALGKSRQIVISSLMAFLLNIVATIIGVKIIGAAGAAIATILVTYLYLVPYNTRVILKASGVKITELLPLRALQLHVRHTILPCVITIAGYNLLILHSQHVVRIIAAITVFGLYYLVVYRNEALQVSKKFGLRFLLR